MTGVSTEPEPSGNGPDGSENYPKNLWEAPPDTFWGNRHNVPRLLAASDLFVLPALWEGLSIALLEAMASGLPIVATAISGTTQVMIAGETGLIVPPQDVRMLAAGIMQLLSDPEEAQALARAARRHVEMHYSARKQADEYLALYRRLLNQPASLH